MSLNVIVLAAGGATRMKSKVHKVMHKIASYPILFHVLRTAKSLEPDRLVLVTSPDMKTVRTQVDREFDDIIHTTQEEAKGTGQAVQVALPHLDKAVGATIVMYGDTPLVKKRTLEEMASKFKKDIGVCLLAMEAKYHNEYGRIVKDGEKVKEIVEFSEATDEQKNITICNCGVMAISNIRIDQLIEKIDNDNNREEYYLTDVVDIAKIKRLFI